MKTKTKTKNFFILAVLILLATAQFAVPPVFAGTIRSGNYYTWGIDIDDVAIPDGSVITEAVMTIHNLSNSSENADDSLYIHLLDEPRVGYVEGADGVNGNLFANQGVLLTPIYRDRQTGAEDLIYTFSNLNDPCSLLWNIFGSPPLVFGTDNSLSIDSSTLLELIDYAGAGESFGFGLDPNGNGNTDYDFDGITLELTIESYQDQIPQNTITFTTLGIPPLGYWSMDDNSLDNARVLDGSGNGNDGAAQENTSVLHAAGISGGALSFNGMSDYVNCGDSGAFDFSGAFSLAAWVKSDAPDSWERVVGRLDTVSNSGYFLGKTTTGDGVWEFATWVAGTRVIIKSDSVPTGGWQFVVATRDADGTMKLYIDGILQPQTGTNPGVINSSGDLLIGANYNLKKAFFDGLIDEVKIYGKALSVDDVDSLYNEVVGVAEGQGGLEAYWALDDNAADTIVADSSNNDNDGTARLNTAYLSAPGAIDSALSFNGSSDYVNCGDSGVFDFSGAFSLAAWAKSDDPDSWERVVGRLDTVTNSGYFLGKTTTGNGVWEFMTRVSGTQVVIKSDAAPTGGWQFIVGTRDAVGNMKLYVDGVLQQQTGANLGVINSSGSLLIGANYNLSKAFFDGLIDEVKIYSKALSVDEIDSLYTEVVDVVEEDDGIEGYWTLDDSAANTTVADSSSNRNNGTARWNTADLSAPGAIDSALSFDGSSDYVNCGDSGAFDFSGAFSLAAWVKSDDPDSWERVVGRLDTVSNSGYFLGKTTTDDGGVWEFATWVAGNKVIIKSDSAPTGGWQFVVATRDTDGTMKLYVDSVLQSQTGANPGVINSSGSLLIGANYNLIKAFFDGLIDEVKIYSKALSASEIIDLYN
ncbi:MAG: LamG domain-containing protein [Planctomycetota bacterium]